MFIGDLVFSQMHAYLADGFHEEWLANLERAKHELPSDAVLLMGHGQPLTDHAILDWQSDYIRRFLATLRTAALTEGLEGDALAHRVTAVMKEYLPTEDLLFLMRLSVAPMHDRLLATS